MSKRNAVTAAAQSSVSAEAPLSLYYGCRMRSFETTLLYGARRPPALCRKRKLQCLELYPFEQPFLLVAGAGPRGVRVLRDCPLDDTTYISCMATPIPAASVHYEIQLSPALVSDINYWFPALFARCGGVVADQVSSLMSEAIVVSTE